MPPSVQGAGGDEALFNACRTLVKGFALGESEALVLLREYNETASPPWGEQVLVQKLRGAARGAGRSGYLLDSLPPLPVRVQPSQPNINDSPEVRRSRWPKFRRPSDADIGTIARLRHLPEVACWIAREEGILSVATVSGYPCFVLHEGHFAQARRLDGGMLPVSSESKKAKNLPGSRGAFLGRSFLERSIPSRKDPVLLVEGAVGLLEAIAAAAITEAPAEAGWLVCAATSASSRFHAEENDRWLQRLQGRHVRIVPDNDESGKEAAYVWTESLSGVGCRVDCVMLPDGCKDLGDVIRRSSGDLDYREWLQGLFTQKLP